MLQALCYSGCINFHNNAVFKPIQVSQMKRNLYSAIFTCTYDPHEMGLSLIATKSYCSHTQPIRLMSMIKYEINEYADLLAGVDKTCILFFVLFN